MCQTAKRKPDLTLACLVYFLFITYCTAGVCRNLGVVIHNPTDAIQLCLLLPGPRLGGLQAGLQNPTETRIVVRYCQVHAFTHLPTTSNAKLYHHPFPVCSTSTFLYIHTLYFLDQACC